MNRAFLDQMRLRLGEVAQEQRQLIDSLGSGFDVEMTASVGELSSVDNHTSDLGNETMERQKDLGLMAQAERTYQLCEEALSRIQQGSYGTCEGCGGEIPMARLEALPYALKCVGCQAADDEDIAFFRPAEEAVLFPPYGRETYSDYQIDRDDAWEIVARHGTANSPQDTPEAYDDDDDATDRGNG